MSAAVNTRHNSQAWVSVAGLAAVAGGVVAAGAILLAPAEAIHAAPNPAIQYTTTASAAETSADVS